MPKRVIHVNDGTIAEVVSQSGEFFWLANDGSPRPWTSPQSLWKPVVPVAGDVWTTPGGGMQYRVLGVDEVNNTFLIVRKERYGNGEWPTVGVGQHLQVDVPVVDFRYIYVRKLPEEYLVFESRIK